MAPALAATLTAAPAQASPADDIRINEVVTTGGGDDSIELYNKGAAAVDVSGRILKDDGNNSKYKIASGTTATSSPSRVATPASRPSAAACPG
ncbi:lamin tail domain-containing protein [Streptomyces sp. NPDC054854]